MSARQVPSTTLVSLQSPRPAGSALEQHLGQGVLVAPDVVLVPDPPDLPDEELTGSHVLAVGPERRGARRAAIRLMEYLILDGRPVCALVVLAEPVVEAVEGHRMSGAGALTESLDTAGTVWPVLGRLVPDGTGPGSDLSPWLGDLPGGLPEVPLGRPVRRSALPSLQIGWSICWIVPWCQPAPTWP